MIVSTKSIVRINITHDMPVEPLLAIHLLVSLFRAPLGIAHKAHLS